MLNEKLTKEQASWLLLDYAKHKDLRIDGTTMDRYFIKARQLMTGKDISRPSCGCEFKVFAQITNSMFGQYKTEIEAVAATEPTTKGRKKANGV